MIGSKRRKLALFTAVAVTVLPACYSWRATDLSPPRFIAERQPPVARLVLRDGTFLVLEAPETVGGAIVGVPTGPDRSLIGVPARVPERSASSAATEQIRVRTPLNAVAAIEERRLNAGRTGVLIGMVAAAGVATLVAVFSNRTHPTGCSPAGC